MSPRDPQQMIQGTQIFSARCAIEVGPSQSRSAGAARRDSQGGAPRRGRPAEIYVPSSPHRLRDNFIHTLYTSNKKIIKDNNIIVFKNRVIRLS